ncbi:rhodanese-like domain-containing protein [Donghicola sp. C2-DW-16]|uniref:Rhodanese-like domain-containing protein n=1 Tax=Donghicola mangrovi TaxID=2729614 RepID=A0ABX2PEN4_9RHOB|nr:rhodanese-like domain-containing protein [Donghicola mangrovi]NVO27960.1 rhodanese-like domain-containing protein [Donghicola mangrovi]
MSKLFVLLPVILIALAYVFWASGQGAKADNVELAALSGPALEQSEDMLVVDIRTPDEWKQTGVIKGAALVTYTSAEAFLQAIGPRLAPGQNVALVCRSGNRSARAANQIADAFAGRVIDVEGGMNRILKEGYTPVKPTRAMGCAVCD